jgi:hypothetical protein
VAQAFALVHEKFGAPYGIFANAGIDAGGLIHEMPLGWRSQIDGVATGESFATDDSLRPAAPTLPCYRQLNG